MGEVLLAEGQLADGPDLGVLEIGDTMVSLEVTIALRGGKQLARHVKEERGKEERKNSRA